MSNIIVWHLAISEADKTDNIIVYHAYSANHKPLPVYNLGVHQRQLLGDRYSYIQKKETLKAAHNNLSNSDSDLLKSLKYYHVQSVPKASTSAARQFKLNKKINSVYIVDGSYVDKSMITVTRKKNKKTPRGLKVFHRSQLFKRLLESGQPGNKTTGMFKPDITNEKVFMITTITFAKGFFSRINS